MALIGVQAGWGPMTVACVAPLGVGMDVPGLDLAGVLAARVVRVLEADGERVADKDMDLPLPLAACEGGKVGWHWAASCVMADETTVEIVGHRRRARVMDMSWLGRAARRPWPEMLASKGPYKDRVTPHQVRGWGRLVWRAVGDVERVRGLLAPVVALGKARGSGEGMVHDWRVLSVPLPEEEWARWLHVDDDGRLLRPVPVECARRWAAVGSWQEGFWGLRPPARARMVDLAVPAVDEAGEEMDPWML